MPAWHSKMQCAHLADWTVRTKVWLKAITDTLKILRAQCEPNLILVIGPSGSTQARCALRWRVATPVYAHQTSQMTVTGSCHNSSKQ